MTLLLEFVHVQPVTQKMVISKRQMLKVHAKKYQHALKEKIYALQEATLGVVVEI